MKKPPVIKAPCEVCGANAVTEFTLVNGKWLATCGCPRGVVHKVERHRYFESQDSVVEFLHRMNDIPGLDVHDFKQCVERWICRQYIGTRHDPKPKQETLI